MSGALNQARSGFDAWLKANGSMQTVKRPDTKSDGVGGTCPDFTKPAIDVEIFAGLARESEGPFEVTDTTSGADSDLSRFVSAHRLTPILIGDLMTFFGGSWRVIKVDPIYKFKGLIGYQATLKEAE